MQNGLEHCTPVVREEAQFLRMHLPKITITQTTLAPGNAAKTPSDMKGHNSARHLCSNSTILSICLKLLYKGIAQSMNMIKKDSYTCTLYDPDLYTSC